MCYFKNFTKKDEFFKNFPHLTFFQKEMYYNFTFDANDLFTIIPDGDRILFNVEFKKEKNKKWEFGKPFFKKYQLSFDLDSKLIKYYINENNEIEIEKEKEKNRNFVKILIIIMLVLFILIIGILFGKLFFSNYRRKIRVNELDEDYIYVSKKNDDKNDNE
jgi:hypothetical protein